MRCWPAGIQTDFLHTTKYCRSNKEPSDARDKAMEEIISKVSEAWSRANASLFKHVLDYESKLNAFLDKAGGWIREQEERHMDYNVPNNRRYWSTIMCQPRCFCSVSWIHCLHFHQIFPTRVSHPSFAGLCLRPMHNPGWGFTA